jgi:uncharacterized protein YdeI (BOF family)
MKYTHLISFFSVILASSNFNSPALSQTPIKDIQKLEGITISGEVTNVVGNDFILDDGTGQVIVDAGPRWWKEINLTPGERVTVTGEMDEGEFDAFSIQRQDGSIIQIRSPDGPPPWSGDGR